MGSSSSWLGRARLLWPFAVLAVLGLLLVPLPGTEIVDRGTFLGAVAVTVTVGLAVVLVPWSRLPADAQLAPALAYLVAVALLRDAAGGASGGMGPLVLIPVVWLALYGTRRQLVVVIGGVAAVWAVPLLLVGAPDYPAVGWRGCVLFVALSAVIGTTVQQLVAQARDQAARAQDRERERDELLARLEQLAATDPLTGLANRRAWEERLMYELADHRTDEAVCLAVLDLDHFKALNDARGHQAGDQALRDSAAAWHAELRPRDTLARIGGDEFAVLLVGCALPGALVVVERLRAATAGGLSCSAGVVQWDGHESSGELQARADALLYRAKRAGRDRSAAPQLRAV